MRFITYQLTQRCWACIDKLCKLSLVQACIYTLLFDQVLQIRFSNLFTFHLLIFVIFSRMINMQIAKSFLISI
ncbi:Uncharacterised protein [Klebsiella pneumoniae]|nr:Uncharacterised protein [Klebsiella pneumoniae]